MDAPFSPQTAEFSFETNAAPIGGYVDSNLREMTAGQDAVLLQTMAWTDDFDDLPLAYEFGFTHGWHGVSSLDRSDVYAFFFARMISRYCLIQYVVERITRQTHQYLILRHAGVHWKQNPLLRLVVASGDEDAPA